MCGEDGIITISVFEIILFFLFFVGGREWEGVGEEDGTRRRGRGGREVITSAAGLLCLLSYSSGVKWLVGGWEDISGTTGRKGWKGQGRERREGKGGEG